MSDKKNKTPIIETPLAKARGYGSAHHGSSHWMAQKVTAVANLFLLLWLICTVVSMKAMGYDEIVAKMAKPQNAILMILFILSSFYHAALGLQVAIEDYIHCGCGKKLLLIAVKLGLTALAVAGIFSILKVAL